jgi:DNA repair protein RecO (recombination protein O)
VILELCLNFLPKREPAPDIFRLLLQMMTALESNADNKLFYLFYKMRFLQAAGYLPGLSACAKCGAGSLKSRATFEGGGSCSVQAEYHHFFVAQGSVICSRCYIGDGDSIALSHSALRFHESLLKWDPSAICRIKAPCNLVEELSDVIDTHIRYVLGPSRFAGKILTRQ